VVPATFRVGLAPLVNSLETPPETQQSLLY
jgi:hypothetical protein